MAETKQLIKCKNLIHICPSGYVVTDMEVNSANEIATAGLVGWSLTSLFSTNTVISEMKLLGMA